MLKKKIKGKSHCEEHKDACRASQFISEQNEVPMPSHKTKRSEPKEALVSTEGMSAFELSGLQEHLGDSLRRP